MNISAEIIWLLVGIVLVFSEFLIPGLVIAFFGIGALMTALLTWVGLTSTLTLQLMVFIAGSIIAILLLRSYFTKIFKGRMQGEAAEMDFNIDKGKIVSVVKAIKPNQPGGQVRYQGSLWAATCSEAVTPGENVRIVGRNNLTLIVEKVKKED